MCWGCGVVIAGVDDAVECGAEASAADDEVECAVLGVDDGVGEWEAFGCDECFAIGFVGSAVWL